MKTLLGWMMLSAWLLTVVSAEGVPGPLSHYGEPGCRLSSALRGVAKTCSGGKIRTSDLLVMSQSSWPLLYAAVDFVAQQNGPRNTTAALSDQHGSPLAGRTIIKESL
jgi:hypothetical protein